MKNQELKLNYYSDWSIYMTKTTTCSFEKTQTLLQFLQAWP